MQRCGQHLTMQCRLTSPFRRWQLAFRKISVRVRWGLCCVGTVCSGSSHREDRHSSLIKVTSLPTYSIHSYLQSDARGTHDGELTLLFCDEKSSSLTSAHMSCRSIWTSRTASLILRCRFTRCHEVHVSACLHLSVFPPCDILYASAYISAYSLFEM